MVNDRVYLGAFVGLILFRIICKVKTLQDLLVSTPCKNALSTIVTNKMVAQSQYIDIFGNRFTAMR